MKYGVGLLLIAALLQAEDPGIDLKSMQGTWRVARKESSGRPDPPEDNKWDIRGDKLTDRTDLEFRGRITADRSRTPGRLMESVRRSPAGPERAKTSLFKIEKDRLTTSYAPLGGEPPADFPAGLDRRYAKDVWERVDGPKGQGLEGTWRLVERSVGLLRMDEQDVKGMTMTIEGNAYVLLNHVEKHAVLRLDPSKEPKQIDLTYTDTALLKGRTFRGIYRLEGDRLSVCLARFNERAERPARFTTGRGDGYLLLELVRDKP